MLNQVQTCTRCQHYVAKRPPPGCPVPTPGGPQTFGPFCNANGSFIRFYDAGYSCPVGPWVPEVVYLRPDGAPPATPPASSAPPRSPEVRSSWQAAFDAVAALAKAGLDLASAGAEFATSVTSEFLASDDPIVLERKASCAACPIRRVAPSGKAYCNGCVCPQSALWPVAELDTKLRFKILLCPRNPPQPGFTNAPPKS